MPGSHTVRAWVSGNDLAIKHYIIFVCFIIFYFIFSPAQYSRKKHYSIELILQNTLIIWQHILSKPAQPFCSFLTIHFPDSTSLAHIVLSDDSMKETGGLLTRTPDWCADAAEEDVESFAWRWGGWCQSGTVLQKQEKDIAGIAVSWYFCWFLCL